MEEKWSNDGEKEETIMHLQLQIQQLESENTDFLAALEDAMEQYKQQVRLFFYGPPSEMQIFSVAVWP